MTQQWSIERIRERLKVLHQQEDTLNTQMENINKQIFLLEKQKKKLAKQVSHNMRYRNRLIEML